MLKNMKLGTKLIVSFLCVAFITMIIGSVGYYGSVESGYSVNELGEIQIPTVVNLAGIKEAAENVRGTVRTMGIPGLPLDVRERQYNNLVKAREKYTETWKAYEALPHTPTEKDEWAKFTTEWDAWRNENDIYVKLCRQFDQNGVRDPQEMGKNLESFRGDHYKVFGQMQQAIRTQQLFEGCDDHTTCNFGKWLATFNSPNPTLMQYLKQSEEPHKQFHDGIRTLKELVKDGKAEQAQELFDKELMPTAEKTFTALREARKIADNSIDLMSQAQKQLLGPLMEKQQIAMAHLEQMVKNACEDAANEVKTSKAQTAFLKSLNLILAVIGVLIAVAFGIFISRAITLPINRIITELRDGADQVTSAAGQVSSASQSLAEGATEQAAGLEETSSSLEEMSSMTKQNADNASQANTLAADAKKAANNGSEAMERMGSAIEDIKRSSDETAKIIKVIDEIAFQTNLLALNAAVEAARAGEAGKGFAVVAEEVRNLAMRSAEAAKNTSNLIEQSVDKSRNGVEICTEVKQALDAIVSSIGKTTDLVGEIAAASNEQAQGVGQINTAISQMDKVTQQNAANAEESASASEELSSQAESVNSVVDQLVALVNGTSAIAVQQTSHAAKDKHMTHMDHAFHQIAEGKKPAAKKSIVKQAKASTAKQIPLDDHEMTEFNG